MNDGQMKSVPLGPYGPALASGSILTFLTLAVAQLPDPWNQRLNYVLPGIATAIFIIWPNASAQFQWDRERRTNIASLNRQIRDAKECRQQTSSAEVRADLDKAIHTLEAERARIVGAKSPWSQKD